MGKQFEFYSYKNDDEMIANTLRSVFGELSVSYTHLDVYKRQGLTQALNGSPCPSLTMPLM